jgi:ATP-binding cassette subfamily C (CFTR/MRP) protein 1
LNMKISENGQNLSVGERQLICISRAILRKSKITVMDEATSSVDNKTETLIQIAINGLLKEYTVITIAHRIKTILNYDKILVMSHGEILEFDTPENLINNKSSYFYEMYSKSNI